MIQLLLQRDDVKGQPFGYAPHSGYHRMSANRTLVLFDCGTPPPGVYSNTAHAGCLAFELSAGAQRLIVNCGTPSQAGHRRWQNALRATAAHSTVTLADTSSGFILRESWVRTKIGARLIHGPTHIETRRMETEKGTTVVACHDGYVPNFSMRHERELTLSPQGLAVTGIDRIVPLHERKDTLTFAIRFHVHPDVRLSTSQAGDVLFKLPNGEGWRMRATAAMAIEESVYLGADMVRRAEQIVVTGRVKNETAEIGWIIEQIATPPN
nr:heparinase II/III family protein [Rhizomicrobium palustre]